MIKMIKMIKKKRMDHAFLFLMGDLGSGTPDLKIQVGESDGGRSLKAEKRILKRAFCC